MPYCTRDDLVVGTDIPLPSNTIADKYVADAANEIDSKIGTRYATPVVVSSTDPLTRPTFLTLQRLNVWIASGRLIMAQAGSSEMEKLHQYGLYLVTEAYKVLENIANGGMILPGATTNDPADGGRSGPMISNLDAASNTEAFYTMVTTAPPLPFYSPTPIFPAGSVTYPPYTG